MRFTDSELWDYRVSMYASKFIGDTEDNVFPTDEQLNEVLGNCSRKPKPNELVAIRDNILARCKGLERAV